MNANHVRPMLAFWLLAAVAAVVTGLGLHEGGSGVTVRAGSPAPVTRTDSSQLVLGGTLQAIPSALGTPTPTSTLPSVTALRDAAHHEGATSTTGSTQAAKTGSSTTTRTRASNPQTRPTTRPRSGGSTSGTTATATTSPTQSGPGQGAGNGHGNGHGNGVGQGPGPGNPGRGH